MFRDESSNIIITSKKPIKNVRTIFLDKIPISDNVTHLYIIKIEIDF